MKILKIFLWIGVFIVAGVIFSFSAQNAQQSNAVSKGVTRKIVDVMPHTKDKTEKEKVEIIKHINNFVRKTAHFTLFFVLGLFLITAMLITYEQKYSVLNIFLISTFLALIYAISDEVHQIFTPNRGPAVKDVFIDLSGSVSAFLIILLLRAIILKIISHKKSQRI